jgi:hypothetical protein
LSVIPWKYERRGPGTPLLMANRWPWYWNWNSQWVIFDQQNT